MDISLQKNELRKIIRGLKNNADPQQKKTASEQIFQQVESLPVFRTAKTILLYWSLPDEVHTHDFVAKWYKQKKILLPIVKGDELELRHFTGLDCLQKGEAFGILEPYKGAPSSGNDIELGIIPGVAFDSKGNRLGRGKAYYDKLLRKKRFFSVGVCFHFQMVEKVPVESSDIPVDRVIFA
ncbi:MAG: 5-formyltetrahydrofolate cyclo-ligase [Bacteroidota bacterium]